MCKSSPLHVFLLAFTTFVLMSTVLVPVPLEASEITVNAGGRHKGCVVFRDPDGVVDKGPITSVSVWSDGYFINCLQFGYGGTRGGFLGFNKTTKRPDFTIPAGEQIVRVKGEYAKNRSGFFYISKLQFITDKGNQSPLFGGKSGTPFDVSDPDGSPLRTISGWYNPRRHSSLHRAITVMTFQFSPYALVMSDKPYKLDESTPGSTITVGRWHRVCEPFRDPEDGVVSKGPITYIRVFCHDYFINCLRLGYGGGGGTGHTPGGVFGFETRKHSNFIVPFGEKIVRIKGEYATNRSGLSYISKLQFITNGGNQSPVFGGRKSGAPFDVSDPNGLPLRTISGWYNPHRHESRNRAITVMTFRFGSDVPVDDQTKVEYLRRYAPRVYLHSEEAYWPSSVEWSFHFLKRYWSDSNKHWWLLTKEELDEPSSVLPYFCGVNPSKSKSLQVELLKLEDVPVYAFWLELEPMPGEVVDLVYFFYYPYNRGKQKVNTVFGNHVGDWEHVTVRLTQQGDSQTLAPSEDAASIVVSAHGNDTRYTWSQVDRVEGTHPIVYSAKGSHGSYLAHGGHTYNKTLGLTDFMNAGTAWDTWNEVKCFDYHAKKVLLESTMRTEGWPNWLKKDSRNKSDGNTDPTSGPVWRWGNYRQGHVAVIGQYRLNHGPTGPIDKPYFGTPQLD